MRDIFHKMENLENHNQKGYWPSIRGIVVVGFFSLVYLCIVGMLIGLRTEHILIIGFYNFCFFAHPNTRKFILAFTIFLVYGIIYDLMKAYPNYLMNNVDISYLYHFEQRIFGFSENGRFVTPNEYFALNHSSSMDVLCGIFYINWIPVPLAFAFYLFLKNKRLFLQFSLTFFFVNLIGFCIYYIHPAAPPWYVNLYGFNLHLNVPGNTAGFARFDNLLHTHVFESIYSRNSNVFAAMPSLHSSYPFIVFYYAIKSNMGWIKWILAVFMTGIWFSAVYSGHHYITDVLAGIVCAVVGIIIFQKVLLKNKRIQNWLEEYQFAIS